MSKVALGFEPWKMILYIKRRPQKLKNKNVIPSLHD
jgi:hypothetical protein